MPSGFPASLSLRSNFGSLVRNGFAVLVVAVCGAPGGTDHLLGWNGIRRFGVDAHEVLTAAGDDVSPVAAVAQVLEKLRHRLIDQLGVGSLPARIFGRLNPAFCFGLKLIDAHAGKRRGKNFDEFILGQLCDRLAVARQHSLEGLDVG